MCPATTEGAGRAIGSAMNLAIRAMARAEGVVGRLTAAQELRDPLLLADALELVAAPGQHLVRVALVTDVEHEAVVGRIEDVVDRRDELDGAEARRQVATGLRDVLEDLGTQLARHAPGANVHVRLMVDNEGSVDGISGAWDLAVTADDPLMPIVRVVGILEPVPADADAGFQQAEGAAPPLVESHYNAMIDIEGNRTQLYDHVSEANFYLKKAGCPPKS